MISREKLNQRVNKKGQKADNSFTRWHDPNYKKYRRYHMRIPHMISAVVGPKVLDIGCGSGLNCYLCSFRNDINEIHGLDLQESVIKNARENVTSEKVTFHLGFAEDLNFMKKTFNTVIMGEVIEHVSDVDAVLKSSAQMLKPKGRVVITCPYKGRTGPLHVRSITKQYLVERVEKYFNITAFEIKTYPGPGTKGIFCVGVKK